MHAALNALESPGTDQHCYSVQLLFPIQHIRPSCRYTTSYSQIYAPNGVAQARNYTSPLLHHTPLPNLMSGTTYYYTCGSAASGMSAEYSFTTAPAPGPAYPLVLGVVADVGQTVNSSITLQHLADSKPRYVTLIGDLT